MHAPRRLALALSLAACNGNTTADEAFAELGIDRTTGYRAIKDGTFPVPVIRVGRLIRVPTAALRRLLDADDDLENPTVTDQYDDDPTTEPPATPTLRLVPRPELAAEITCQPVRRHRVDAGIFFSDIVIPCLLYTSPSPRD